MQLADEKKALRRRLLHSRRNDRYKDDLIYRKLITIPQFLSAELVLTYVSMPDEIDTEQLINCCLGLSKKIAVPKVSGEYLVFKQISGYKDLEQGYFGVREPRSHCSQVCEYENSVCIVPALACNKNNHRIGYGRGFYDRFLKGYSGFSIALCYKSGICDIPVDERDMPVDLVLTD